MCYSTLSFCAQCEVCGRHHPGGPAEQCYAFVASDIDAELEAYLATPEARFFAWLAERD